MSFDGALSKRAGDVRKEIIVDVPLARRLRSHDKRSLTNTQSQQLIITH